MSTHDYAESAFTGGHERRALIKHIGEDATIGSLTLTHAKWHELSPTKKFRFIFTETLTGPQVTALAAIVTSGGAMSRSDWCNVQTGVSGTATVDWGTGRFQQLNATGSVTSSGGITMLNPEPFVDLHLMLYHNSRSFAFVDTVNAAGGSLAYSSSGSKYDLIVMLFDTVDYWVKSFQADCSGIT